MEKAYQYIKRILAFLLCSGLFVFSVEFISYLISLPLLVLAFSLIHSRITGEKPPHLFAYNRTEAYFKKGGLRDLLRIMVTLFGFVSDTIIWTVWGVYQVFMLMIDILFLVKTVLYWIVHGILWFLRQYVPFFVFLYRIGIHYLIRWPWWLYQISWYNIRYAYNRNIYRVALNGTLQACFIIFLFYFLDMVLENVQGLVFIGMLIALLPLAWSLGEIAVIRAGKKETESYRSVRDNFSNGIETVRSILFYITLFVVLLLAQLALDLTGWIPGNGILVAGFIFDLNTFISLILLMVCILIVLGVLCIPSYRLYTRFSETRLNHILLLLKTLGKKFLQYIMVLFPSVFFTLVSLVLPLLILIILYILSFTIKNEVVQIKIDKLKIEQASASNSVKAYEIGEHIRQLIMLQRFPVDIVHQPAGNATQVPGNIVQEMYDRNKLATLIMLTKENIDDARADLLGKSADFEANIKNLNDEIETKKNAPGNGDVLDALYRQEQQAELQYKQYRSSGQLEISKSEIHLNYLRLRYRHIPVLFLAAGLWLVIFGGMVAAFGVAYLGNVLQQLYIFRNDEMPTEWTNIVRNIRAEDHKQPLLGGTLTLLTIVLAFYLVRNFHLIQGLAAYLSAHLNP